MYGWRTLFIGTGILFAVVSATIAICAPKDKPDVQIKFKMLSMYKPIVRSAFTWKIGVLGLTNYAILVAVQTLWIGPWLTEVAGETTRGASIGLLLINLIMLFVFLIMGYFSPRIIKSADDAELLLKRFVPISVSLLFVIAALGANANWVLFAFYCVAAWPLSVTHPLVGQRFRPEEAGRAIAFFNLLLFIGVFAWQWTFGAIVSALSPSVGQEVAFQTAMASLGVLSVFGYGFFFLYQREASNEVK